MFQEPIIEKHTYFLGCTCRQGYRVTQPFPIWRVGSPYNPVYVQLSFWLLLLSLQSFLQFLTPNFLEAFWGRFPDPFHHHLGPNEVWSSSSYFSNAQEGSTRKSSYKKTRSSLKTWGLFLVDPTVFFWLLPLWSFQPLPTILARGKWRFHVILLVTGMHPRFGR